MTKKILELAHFGPFGNTPFLQMAHLKTCPNSHHSQGGLEICHTNFTSTLLFISALQVPEAILLQTLEKGTQGLALRRKEEYKLWENSK